MSLPDPIEIRHGPYRIQKSSGRPLRSENLGYGLQYFSLFSDGLWALYMTIRFSSVMVASAQSPTFMWRTWLILFAEVCLSVWEFVSIGFTCVGRLYALDGTPFEIRPCYRLVGDEAPTVDVAIPCCREPIDVVLDTVTSVLAQDYPAKQLRVLVLDDGHDDLLEEAIQALGRKAKTRGDAEPLYLSRHVPAEVNSYYKAGNLQYGIDHGKGEGGSEFFASLDADMIPEREWLRKMVPHLILDDNLALACPPQTYYNVPESDPFGQKVEWDIFLDFYDVMDDTLDPALNTGSGFVVRRSALNAIGGWPQVNAGEDFMGSALMAHAGRKVAFIREQLQKGLAPGSMRAHIKQRERWVDSGIEVHKYFKFYFPGFKVTSKWSGKTRVNAIMQLYREYAPLTMSVGLFVMPIALLLVPDDGIAGITSTKDVSRLKMAYLWAFIAKRMNERILFSRSGISRGANFQSNEVWCAPYGAARCIISFLPTHWYSIIFESTASIRSPVNERSRKRMRLPSRLFNMDFFMPSLYLLLLTVMLTFLVPDTRSGSFPFLSTTMKLVECAWRAAVPVVYMLWPPTVPERDELMEMDEFGVRRPKGKSARGGQEDGGWWAWKDVAEIGALCLCF